MPKHVFSDGCRVRIREYEVREIDRHGEIIDVDQYETRAEAEKVAKRNVESPRDGVVACVIELHTSWHPAHLFRVADKYKTLSTYGDRRALRKGGWIK
jgi:hypothetical protein